MTTSDPDSPLPSYIQREDDGYLVRVVVAPRAKRSRFMGLHGGVPRISLAAPPIEGRANEALLDFLRTYFKVSKQSVQFRSGDTSKRKSVFITGVSLDQLLCALQGDS